MDPLRSAIAFVPLAAYLLLLGVVNLRRRPLLTTGASDAAALGAALTGVAFVGPLELFRPEAATAELGNYIWLFLVALYWLWVTLVAMIGRPRLVVYNVSLDELRPALAAAVAQVDPDARWAGDSLKLPRLAVSLHLDAFPLMRHTSLVSSGGDQDLGGWRKLKKALGRALQEVKVAPNPRSPSLIAISALMLGVTLAALVRQPTEVAQAVSEILAF